MKQSRRVESVLVAHIAEVDARRLFAREASPSMFQYAVDVLHLSKAEAYLRIEVARASRRHPKLLTELADGRFHLSGIAELAPKRYRVQFTANGELHDKLERLIALMPGNGLASIVEAAVTENQSGSSCAGGYPGSEARRARCRIEAVSRGTPSRELSSI